LCFKVGVIQKRNAMPIIELSRTMHSYLKVHYAETPTPGESFRPSENFHNAFADSE